MGFQGKGKLVEYNGEAFAVTKKYSAYSDRRKKDKDQIQ